MHLQNMLFLRINEKLSYHFLLFLGDFYDNLEDSVALCRHFSDFVFLFLFLFLFFLLYIIHKLSTICRITFFILPKKADFWLSAFLYIKLMGLNYVNAHDYFITIFYFIPHISL